MKKKRVLSLLLALCLALALVPATALAADYSEVIPLKYDYAHKFSEGLAAVKLNGKWGFIDKTGQEVVPFKYTQVCDFTEGLAAVLAYGGWGVIDKTGREVVPCQYDEIASDNMRDFCGFSEGMMAVCIGDYWEGDAEWGFIDHTGEEVIPRKYDFAKNFSEGLAAVELDGKWGFIDKTGVEVIPLRYDRVGDFSEGLAAVCIGDYANGDGKWGFIDKTGKEVIPCQYTDVTKSAPFAFARGFSEGLVAVVLDGKWGFIDGTGEEVVPFLYGDAEDFHEGLAAVSLAGKWGCIDKTGKEVVPFQYENPAGYIGCEVLRFREGRAIVQMDGKLGLVDKTGREVAPCKYSEMGDFFEGYSVVVVSIGEYYMKTSQRGFIDANGEEVVPLGTYSGMGNVSEGLAAVALDGKWGYISFNDSTTTPQTAYPSTQTVLVDGKPVTFHAYALKDANGNETNYIKLRDVAAILSGSAAQFAVGWDGSITITTKTAYTPNGSENIANFSGNQSYTVNTSPVKVNGAVSDLEAITLTDSAGGGYTYFKLRDLGEALGFNVSWDAANGISIDSNSPYDPTN